MKKVTFGAMAGVAALLASPLFAHQHETTHGEYHASFTKLGEGKPIMYTGRPIYQHVKAGDLPSESACSRKYYRQSHSALRPIPTPMKMKYLSY
tara:strand:+ start:277 stop:558 length:282 start_codon:yes stop_codon:yes gene_type:complete